jgi:hypothetical protein
MIVFFAKVCFFRGMFQRAENKKERAAFRRPKEMLPFLSAIIPIALLFYSISAIDYQSLLPL